MVKIREKIMIIRLKFKQKLSEYFLIKNWIATFSYTIKRFYVVWIGFDKIFYGIKNPKDLNDVFWQQN